MICRRVQVTERGVGDAVWVEGELHRVLGLETFEEILRRERSSAGSSSTSSTRRDLAVALGTRGLAAASIAVVVMIVYQQLENHVLQQLVYHRTVRLSPLAIALSVAAGAELAGVPGALLGIPFAGALLVVSKEVVAYRRGEDAPA